VAARAIIVVGLALLASLQVVRTAVVSAYAEKQPAIAERIWSGHPEVKLSLAMTEIGQAAAGGKTVVPAAAVRRVELASKRDPLAVEPFLIKATLAKTQGHEDLAERLFVEVRTRDPRSAAARYFLAERYLSSGRARQGLDEVSALARLVPGGSRLVVPGLAKYALTPNAVPHLRRIFAANPEIGQAVLTDLAANAANAGLIMQLADARVVETAGEPAPAWQGRLLKSLIERGEFVQAQQLWSRISGIMPTSPPGPVNEGFAKINAPPPFNWTFGAGSFGVAEPAPRGKLKVIFYGRDDGDLAAQLLVLPPGQYRIAMVASSDADGKTGLEWSVTCVPGKEKLASISLKAATASGARLGATFTIPSHGCVAQWLKLTGQAQEIARSEQATIGEFDLSPVGAR
jgi:hypothetical protein